MWSLEKLLCVKLFLNRLTNIYPVNNNFKVTLKSPWAQHRALTPKVSRPLRRSLNLYEPFLWLYVCFYNVGSGTRKPGCHGGSSLPQPWRRVPPPPYFNERLNGNVKSERIEGSCESGGTGWGFILHRLLSVLRLFFFLFSAYRRQRGLPGFREGSTVRR